MYSNKLNRAVIKFNILLPCCPIYIKAPTPKVSRLSPINTYSYTAPAPMDGLAYGTYSIEEKRIKVRWKWRSNKV